MTETAYGITAVSAVTHRHRMPMELYIRLQCARAEAIRPGAHQ